MNNKYVVYCCDEGYTEFGSLEDAKNYAREMIEEFLDPGCNEWDENVENIYVAKITHKCIGVKLDIEPPEGCDVAVDYSMRRVGDD